MSSPQRVLITGATGYIGGRLAPRMLEAGHTVRVAVRRRNVTWAPTSTRIDDSNITPRVETSQSRTSTPPINCALTA